MICTTPPTLRLMIAVNRVRPFTQSRRFVLTKVGETLYRSAVGSYFAVIKYQGKQHCHCLKTKDREIARKKLAEYRQQLQGHPAADNAALSGREVTGRWPRRGSSSAGLFGICVAIKFGTPAHRRVWWSFWDTADAGWGRQRRFDGAMSIGSGER